MTTSVPFDFLSFVKDYGPGLRRRIRPHLGPHGGELDDVMQDVLSRLWTRRAEFATAEDAERFCLAQAAYVTKNNARRTTRSARATLTPPAASPDPARVAEADALLGQVRGVLSERQAAVWFAMVLEGRSREELAASLGATPHAVSVALHKAWTRLREHRHLFRSLLAGLVLLPRRRPVGTRPVAAWCGAVATIATGLSLIIAPLDGRSGAPTSASVKTGGGVESAIGTAPHVPRWDVRERRTDARRGWPRVPGHPEHEHTVSSSKVTGCLPAAVLCTAGRDDRRADRRGHGVWLAVSPLSGQPQEVYQRAVPLCVLVAELPDQDLVGCVRHSETDAERVRGNAALPRGQDTA